MEVKSWNDSLGDPAESKVVMLYLALEGEVHYYSTKLRHVLRRNEG
jgi:hypothetical protein